MVDLLLERGFAVRVIDNLTGGHRIAISTIRKDQRVSTCHWQDIRTLEPGLADLRGRPLRVPFRRHRRHRALDRAADRIHGRQRPGHRARAGMRARRRASRNSSTRPRRPATGWPRRRPAKTHPIAPQYPYALSKYQGEQAAFHWHQVYGCRSTRSAFSTPTVRACARPAPMARCSACSCGRSSPESRLPWSATERRRATSST